MTTSPPGGRPAAGTLGSGVPEGATLWFVSPVYLDTEAFAILRRNVLRCVAADADLARWAVRFVVMDDTAGADPQVAGLAALPDVTVVEPPFNLGHQRGIVYALRTVSAEMHEADIVVTLDADGEDRPEDLPRLLRPLLDEGRNNRKVAIALRTKRRESATFRVMYLAFRLMFRFLTGVTIRNGNYAAYRGWLAQRMLRHPYFDLCYSSTLATLMPDAAFVPCERGTRYAGRSRMTYSRLFLHGVRMLMPLMDRIAIRALIIFSGVLALGGVMALVVLGVKLFTNTGIPGWATYTLLLILIISFVALGNFIVLFVVFSQSRGVSLANLESTASMPPRRGSG